MDCNKINTVPMNWQDHFGRRVSDQYKFNLKRTKWFKS